MGKVQFVPSRFSNKNKKRQKRKRTIKNYMARHEDKQKDSKAKTVIDFDNEQTTSIESFVIQKKLKVNLTTRFIKATMMMFNKTSLCSFVFDMIDLFCFPQEYKAVKSIYEKHKIQKCFFYQSLTNTDSTSWYFCFHLWLKFLAQ